jgi:hypothetical protein
MTSTTIKTLAASLALTSAAFAGSGSGKNITPPAAPAPASDALGINLDVGYETQYIFRGAPVSDQNVWGALSTEINLGGPVSLGLSAWYTSATDGLDYEELDLSPALYLNTDVARFGVVYTWYKFFDGNLGNGIGLDEANELGLTVSKAIGPVNVNAGYYYDFTDEGHYVELGLDAPIKLCDRSTLVPSALVSYGNSYYSDEDGLQHVKLGLALDYKLTDNATLTPWIAGNIPLDTYESFYGDDIYGGVKLRVSF